MQSAFWKLRWFPCFPSQWRMPRERRKKRWSWGCWFERYGFGIQGEREESGEVNKLTLPSVEC